MRYGICLDTLYTELDFYDRFAAAARDGFDAVEFWDWRTRDLARVKRVAEQAGIAISGFNGDADFSPIDPEQRDGWLNEVARSIDAAQTIGASSVTIHSNALGEGGRVVRDYAELSDAVKLSNLFDALQEASLLAEASGIRLHLEALNTHVDHVGNYLRDTRTAAELVAKVGSDQLMLLQDIYHMQINEGSLIDNIVRYGAYIGHVQIAEVPGRHEPGTGEINYVNVLRALKATGYRGIVSCELFPKEDTPTAIQAVRRLIEAVEA